MARHNYVDILGVVRETEENEIFVGVLKNGRSDAEIEDMSSITYIKVKAENNGAEVNDVVRVTGFMATREIIREAECPVCGVTNTRMEGRPGVRSNGTETYVHAISMYVEKRCKSASEACMYLRERREMASHVFLMGNLTRDPVLGESNGVTYCRYQIGICRKFYTKDDVGRKQDFPWIYSYGKNALQDMQYLKKGSLVFVDGGLQSRHYNEKYVCKECGEEFPVSGDTLEVVSYSTEYLSKNKGGEKSESIQTDYARAV